jgi:serine protease, subtilase family
MEEMDFQTTFFSFIGKAGDTVSVDVRYRRNVGVVSPDMGLFGGI